MLIDTSGFLCLHHRAEPQHADATILFGAASFRLTHSYVRFAHQRLRLMVLAEFVALAYSRGLPRRESLSFVADIQDDPEIEVVYVDERLHRDALNLLQERLDKTWSLCSLRSVVTS